MVPRFARGVVLLAGVAALTGSAWAQTRDIADEPAMVPMYADPSQPADMTFTEISHDFGTISDDAEVEHLFRFTNTGTGTLRIAATKGSCSCTVPAPSKREFEPGEQGEIRVIYDPKGKAGEQTQVVTITTNDPETPVFSLKIRAMVVPQVMVSPRVGHFGEVAKDQGAEIELTVTGRDADFEVTGVELSDPELFEASFSETIDTPLKPETDGSEHGVLNGAQTVAVNGADSESAEPEMVRQSTIKVRLKPGQEIGLIRNKTVTILTNDKTKPTVTVELMAQHMGDIAMTPRRITLGSLPAGADFQREVTLRSLSGKPFKVLGIEHTAMAEDAVEYSFTPIDPENPTAYRFSINGVMPEDARVLRGRFVIRTDVEREEQLYLHYYGQQRPAGTQDARGTGG